MCLYTRWIKPRVATKDIIVYKTLNAQKAGKVTVMDNAGKVSVTQKVSLTSRGQNFTYTLGKLNTNPKFGFQRHGAERNVNTVDEGFHSYQRKSDALRDRGVTVQCRIPKGSLYYDGTNNGTTLGVCSNQLIVENVI